MKVPPFPKRKTRPTSIIFFALISIVAWIGAPIYIYKYGLSFSEIALFIFYTLATSFAITMGYHRLYAHATYKAHPLVNFWMLFFGAATFEQSALKWSSLHRVHHQYTDTARDPYNIKQGFFHAHIGWIMFWKQSMDYDNTKDLQKNKLVMHQHKHYKYWSFGAGLITPLIIGALTGHLWGALILSVAVRLVIVFNSAFFINSYAHTFGSRPFDPTSSARDHWLGAILTNGEGYHNFHHKFPIDYRNGIYWYHWDPSKWAIWVLSKIGLASDLRSTPARLVEQAKAQVRLTQQPLSEFVTTS